MGQVADCLITEGLGVGADVDRAVANNGHQRRSKLPAGGAAGETAHRVGEA